MGIVARWIDTLGPLERDAILQHPDPTYGGQQWWNLHRDCGCLVGCAVEAAPELWRAKMWFMGQRVVAELQGTVRGIPEPMEWEDVGGRFPKLCRRFTPERMWRLVKARARRGYLTTADVQALQYEPVGIGMEEK